MYNISEEMSDCILRLPSENTVTLELCADRDYSFTLSVSNDAGEIAMIVVNFSKSCITLKT